MISFLHPYILLLIPLTLFTRLLFKKNDVLSNQYVPYIFLWNSLATAKTTTGTRAKANPMWILSTLILTFIIIALAKPVYITDKPELIVWLDTSESMFSRENTVSRITLGLRTLAKELKKHGISRFHLRLIGDPNYNRSLDINSLNVKKLTANRVFSSPKSIKKFPEIQFNSHKKYWLITDGSEHGMQSWVDTSPISKVINVGHQTENTEISYMAVRKSLSGKNYDGFVIITNHGLRPNQRALIIKVDNKTVLREKIHVLPGHSVIKSFSTLLNIKNHLLTSQILPNDNLAIDDKLILGKLPVLTKKISVKLDERCPEIIHKILSAYPDLSISKTISRTDLFIKCGDRPVKSLMPYFYICSNHHKYALGTYPNWHTNKQNLNDIYISPNEVMANAIITNNPNWTNLLTYGKYTLIRFNRHQKSLEMYINLTHSPITQKLIFPIIINNLLEMLLNTSLLDKHDIARQPYNDSNIIPVKILGNSSRSFHATYTSPESNALLALATMLVIIEILAKNTRNKST